MILIPIAGADPGFPVGARGPPTWALFGENVCKNERIGSRGRGVHRKFLYVDPPMHCVWSTYDEADYILNADVLMFRQILIYNNTENVLQNFSCINKCDMEGCAV